MRKDDKANLVNRLLSGEPPKDKQIKQFRAGYVGTAGSLEPHTVPVVVRTHNTVEDGPQRPTSDVGGVYTYEAIAPVEKEKGKERPVRLRSELRLRTSLAARLPPDWAAKLGGRVSLGRSKKDDYGEVTIAAEGSSPFASAAGPRDNELFVWLLSEHAVARRGAAPRADGKDAGGGIEEAAWRRRGRARDQREPP